MPEPVPPFFDDSDRAVARVAELLRAGEIVAVPTETVYGLAGNALDTDAVRKIFEAKGRPLIDPLIVHVHDFAGVEKIAKITPPATARIQKIITNFWPGPLTVILEKRECVPALVTAGMNTVAVRVPAHPLMRRVLEKSGLALAAPSANPFGYVSPTTARHVRDSLGEKARWILDGGACRHGLESTIVNLTDPAGVRLLRPGPIAHEALEAALGEPVLPAPAHLDAHAAQVAPGMLARHYSPRTPIFLRPAGDWPATEALAAGKHAVVWLARPKNFSGNGAEDFWLSEDGNPATAASNVFALLRRLDAGGFSTILAELAPETGIGVALNDRLRRAAAKR